MSKCSKRRYKYTIGSRDIFITWKHSWQEIQLENNNVGAAFKNPLEECSLTEEVLSGDVLFDKAADL